MAVPGAAAEGVTVAVAAAELAVELAAGEPVAVELAGDELEGAPAPVGAWPFSSV
ncbi:MAG: hypothetical protein HIU81_04560 [Acidobacteria bacterium]|nr:hypothetical protein [Acidobacteriota bacterium]